MNPEPAFLDALQDFLLAGSWNASRAVLRTEPELLSPPALHYLQALVQEAHEAGDPRAERVLTEHREVLERCRERGIDSVFAELDSREPGSPQPQAELERVLGELSREPGGNADAPRRIELCERALELVDQAADPELWALLHASLGTWLVATALGERASNVERALASLTAAIPVLRTRSGRLELARTLNNLGQAYEDRLAGEPRDNVDAALAAYAEALEAFGSADVPEERAQTLNNMANALNRRQRGRIDENRERAIAAYREALTLLSRDEHPIEWAQTQVNLAIALTERIPGEPAENLAEAIGSFHAALKLLDATVFPMEWAIAHSNLGTALLRRAMEGTGTAEECASDREEAIAAYEVALEVFSELRIDHDRARTLANLGNALIQRELGDRSENIERAIACCTEALSSLDPARTPLEWGRAQNNLGNAYRARSEGERAENTELAIRAYLAAQEILTRASAPIDYAQIQKNLGACLAARAPGDAEENLGSSIAAYREALSTREEVYGPDHPRVASVLYSLAKVERRAGRLGDARASLERALRIDEATEHGPNKKLGRRYRRLADTAVEMGDLDAARRAIMRAMELDEQLLGAEHADVQSDLIALAQILRLSADLEGATRALERALVIDELAPGRDHPKLRPALTELADLLERAGHLARAQRIQARAVALDEALYGPDHPQVANSLVKLADLLHRAHETARAEETLARAQKLVESSRYVRGRPRLAATMGLLSRMLANERVDMPYRELEAAAPESGLEQAAACAVPVTLSFTETLGGEITFTGAAGDRVEPLELQLEVAIEDLNGFIHSTDAEGDVAGHLRCGGLGGERPVERGTYNILHDRRREGRRRVIYRLDFRDASARPLALIAHRVITDDLGPKLLKQTTTVHVSIFSGADATDMDRSATAVASGVLRSHHLDFLKQLGSYRLRGPAREPCDEALSRFGRLSMGALWDGRGSWTERVPRVDDAAVVETRR